METISIIIVSYNTKDILAGCLRSVFASEKTDFDLEVFVVDNASEDGSADMVARDFPQVTLIDNQDNAGFAKANNQAFACTKGDYIFLLNPDTIISVDAISNLLAFCKGKKIGIVAPKLQFDDGTLQPSCYNLPTIGRALQEFFFGITGSYIKYAPNVTESAKVDAVAGAAIFLPRSTTDALGGLFDEKFFFFYEDIDLCRRIGRLGLPIYYLPDVTITHFHGSSTKKRGDWAYEQNQRSAKIYFGPIRYAIITAILKYGQKWQKLLKMLKHQKSDGNL